MITGAMADGMCLPRSGMVNSRKWRNADHRLGMFSDIFRLLATDPVFEGQVNDIVDHGIPYWRACETALMVRTETSLCHDANDDDKKG